MALILCCASGLGEGTSGGVEMLSFEKVLLSTVGGIKVKECGVLSAECGGRGWPIAVVVPARPYHASLR